MSFRMLCITVGAVSLMACGGPIAEDAEGYTPEQDPQDVKNVSCGCSAGFHLHTIDFSEAGFYRQKYTCGSDYWFKMKYGEQFCMRDGEVGYSCGGYWYTYGHLPCGNDGYVRIQALNGH